MKIAILGAGIAGITSAYVLASRGHDVEVIEGESAAALQTSFSNGAQLSYSHAEPWANPGAFKQAAKWAFNEDAPLVMRPRMDWDMFKWSLQFMSNCTTKRAKINCERMMRIALYSREKLKDIREATKVEFDFGQKGILHVFSQEKSYESAIKQAKFQESLGCFEKVVSKQECLEIEPALKEATKPIIGGIFSDIDETGDIHLFTQNLAKHCAESMGVTFSYDTKVMRMNMTDNQITSVTTSGGDVTADAYVMCLGPYSPKLLNPIGIKLPIYPMKGYSITMDAWENAPEVSVTDDEKKVVFSRIGSRVRAAGTAEFAGYNTQVRESRINQILGSLQDLYPNSTVENLAKWACIRPQTPDGPPIVGRSTCPNLYLNTGHGTLGWTQGAGTAFLLADVLEKRPTDIKLAGFEMSRYRK